MDIFNTMRTRRTIRLYKQREVPYDALRLMADAGRMAPSARNIQPLEFMLVGKDGPLGEMFNAMGFGGKLEKSEFQGRMPTAYVVVLVNKALASKSDWVSHDSGLATENICLAAWDMGIGSCILARFDKAAVRGLLRVPESHDIDLVISLGYPGEQPAAEEMDGTNSDHSTSRDDSGVLRVPKRRLDDLIHKDSF